MNKQYDVCILGATGAVGEAMLSILEQRKFPVRNLYPLASSRSAGSTVQFNGAEMTVIDVDDFDFAKARIGLFSAGGSVSEKYAPIAAAAGCVVIDNTAHFRYDRDIPLVVPEVNPHAIAQYKNRGIIANPNCSTTYQAVSGTGKEAIDELAAQTRALFNQQDIKVEVYPKRIAFNVLPQIDVFMENGYTKEEMKMVWETHKIMEDDSIQVNPTAARVPVFYGHSEAIHIETRKKITASEARALLDKAPGVVVMDKREPGGYPTAI
jgi:aspartate-semialdehyde dehydrogenase